MSSVLTTVIGPYGLAIPAPRVRELLAHTEPDSSDADRQMLLWRGQWVPMVDLRQAFGTAPGAVAVDIVVGEQEAADLAAIVVDQVVGLSAVEADHWQPMPRVGRILGICDAVCVYPIADRLMFRLSPQADFASIQG
jgi:chemotaxis signal transduction protein